MVGTKRKYGVYRLYDSNNRIVYIGLSNNPLARLYAHANKNTWLYDVDCVKIEWFDCRLDAAQAETTGISSEKPKYNKLPAVRKKSCIEPTAEDIARLIGLRDKIKELYNFYGKYSSLSAGLNITYENMGNFGKTKKALYYQSALIANWKPGRKFQNVDDETEQAINNTLIKIIDNSPP